MCLLPHAKLWRAPMHASTGKRLLPTRRCMPGQPNAPVALHPVRLPAVRRCYHLSETSVDIRRGPFGAATGAAEPVLTWRCVGVSEQSFTLNG